MPPKICRPTLALLIALSLSGLALAQSGAGSAKVATVNGVAIPKSRVDAVVRAQEAQGQKDTLELRATIRDRLITLEIVGQEAARKGLAKSADTVSQLELARLNILAQAYRADFFKNHPIGEDALKAEFEKLKTQMGDKEYKARHVLLEKESEALEVIEKLKKGEKFEDLAKLSKDPGSRERAGQLDWNLAGGFVKPFSEAMVKLEKGKYTEAPVQTQFGWHVIMLDDSRPAKFPEFKDARKNVQQRMQEALFDTEINKLRAKAKVE